LTDDADYGQDKLEKGAAREGKNVWEVAEFYTNEFLRDMRLLNNLPPTHQPKATEYITEQIQMVERLEEKGFTYRTDMGIAFDTSKFANYTALSKMPLDKLCEGARVEFDKQKRNPTDFYLWKFSQPVEKRQMEWDSPWGRGFPGWHIECSAMAKAILGVTIDIHCGGIDHITVHHSNEIAQSEAANDALFAKYWMHNNFLTLEPGLKMAKSAENFLRMQTVLEQGFHPLAYRYMCLSAHYRSELLFGWEQLHAAQHTLRRLKQFLYGKGSHVFNELRSEWVKRFKSAMEEDLDTPTALSILHEMMSSNLSDHDKVLHLVYFDRWFGLGFDRDVVKDAFLSREELQTISIANHSLFELIQQRNKARAERDWKTSDDIREQIKDVGLDVEDRDAETYVPRGLYREIV
jgi:cysteinyl-tRNA synthetase